MKPLLAFFLAILLVGAFASIVARNNAASTDSQPPTPLSTPRPQVGNIFTIANDEQWCASSLGNLIALDKAQGLGDDQGVHDAMVNGTTLNVGERVLVIDRVIGSVRAGDPMNVRLRLRILGSKVGRAGIACWIDESDDGILGRPSISKHP